MTKKNLSFEDVSKAAMTLEKQGLDPNTKNIREFLGSGSLTTISKFLQKWKGEKDQVAKIEEVDLKEILEKMGHDFFVEFFSNEHPQVIALVLSHLNIEDTALVLNKFPQNLRQNILERLEKQGPVQKNIVFKIAKIIKDDVETIINQTHVLKGGRDFVTQVKKEMQERGEK